MRQAEQALRIHFVNFLQRTDWRLAPSTGAVDAEGRTTPLEALHLLRRRIRARHYSYRTECSYADWVRRFLDYCAQRDGRRPRVTADAVRDFLTPLGGSPTGLGQYAEPGAECSSSSVP